MSVLLFWPALAAIAHAAAFTQFAINIVTPEDQAQVRRRAFTVIQGGRAAELRQHLG